MKDIAGVPGRTDGAAGYRGFGQSVEEEMAKYAGVPVHDDLTDQTHPTRIFADFMTMRAFTHKCLPDLVPTLLGDGRDNAALSPAICRIWSEADSIAHVHALCKETGAKLTVTETAVDADKGADFLCTAAWLSKGEDGTEWGKRIDQEIGNPLEAGALPAPLLAWVRADSADPAFQRPGKPIGPSCFGSEAAIDTDRVSALLARQLTADMLLLLTDVDAVHLDFGTPKARRFAQPGAQLFSANQFVAAALRPRVAAATHFAAETCHSAAIGWLDDAMAMWGGQAGTLIEPGVMDAQDRD